MIINQNILAISSKPSKNIYETFYTKETTSKTAATELFRKILNIKEISNKQFNIFDAKISLDEIKRSITFQTNEYQ